MWLGMGATHSYGYKGTFAIGDASYGGRGKEVAPGLSLPKHIDLYRKPQCSSSSA